MKVIGIVAEYNPFHKGHAYQLTCAKKRFGADAVVVVMSGCFTQRGTPAIFDKDARSRMALACGADLIFELPVIFSSASAEIFAKGAVSLLHSTGIVDDLLFGCEAEEIALFHEAVTALSDESDIRRKALREKLSSGKTYAHSQTASLESPALEAFLSTPNNLLGVEYLKALRDLSSPIRPLCLKRRGSQYHDANPSGDYISASALRKMLEVSSVNTWAQIKTYIPESAQKICREKLDSKEQIFADDVSMLLHERLYETEDFSVYSDCSKALSRKILKHRDAFTSFEQFCHLLKSKDVTLARIRRMLCHILLRMKKEDTIPVYRDFRPPYMRLLGFTDIGAHLLPSIKKQAAAAGIPLFLMAKEADGLLSKTSAACLSYDLYAANLYRILLTQKTGKCYPTEFTKKYEKFGI